MNNDPVDLNDVAIFTAVVKAGSFSSAALALQMPKATVSRRVRRLEHDLGVCLLHRTTRKLQLSGAGREYYDTVARALAQLDDAHRSMNTVTATPSGTLEMTAPIAFGEHFLIPWVAEFLTQHRAVNIELSLTDEPIDVVGRGLDLAFMIGPLPDSRLIARQLAPTGHVFAASPTYLARVDEPRGVADLGNHGLIVGPSAASDFGRAVARSYAELGPITARLRVDNMSGAIAAVIAGAGIALLPYAIAARYFARGQLKRVLPDVSVPTGGLFVCYPSDRLAPAAACAFLDFVRIKAKAIPIEEQCAI